MSRPRVLHVYKDYFPPVLGGVENTMNLMARGTLDEFDVRVLVNSGTRQLVEENIDGVHVTRVPELFRVSSAPFSPAFPAALKRAAANADILHFHHPNPTGDISYFMARTDVPVVMTYHSDIVRQKFGRMIFAPIQERMMERCHTIMPTSVKYLESSHWLDRHRNRCRVVPLGIELKQFEKTPEIEKRAQFIRDEFATPLVVFLGKLRYYKGLEYLIRAMVQVDATLIMIGGGPDFERLREIAHVHKITPRSRFMGELSHFETVAHLYAADVFCLPSHLRSEAFGLSQVEAMACGLPVVTTNILTGVSYVNQDGVTGYTVDPMSPDALSNAIRKILCNESLKTEMGKAARHRAYTQFSADRMCRDLKEVYREALSGNNFAYMR